MEVYIRVLVSFFPISFETDLHYDSLTSLQCAISWKNRTYNPQKFYLKYKIKQGDSVEKIKQK